MAKSFATGHSEHIGRGDHAGMPQEVKMEKYPKSKTYPGGSMDDTMTGIDEVNSRAETKASKYRSNQKQAPMVMIRPKGKAEKIAKRVMKGRGVKIQNPKKPEKKVLTGPYLQH